MICLSLYGTTDEIRDAIDSSPEADLYEIRLDMNPSADPEKIRSATSKPLIFTAHNHQQLLKRASEFADYLDVGPSSESCPEYIVSFHGSNEDPIEMWNQYSGAHITKIVLETSNYRKIQQLSELNRTHHPNALCFAMGEVGAFSRILSVLAGAPWIYASMPGKATAPGQFTLQQLTEIYRIKRFDEEPKAVFGIIGNPVSHSRSPEFHNRKFSEENLPWIYLPFQCEDLRSLFEYAAGFGVRGFSITHPFKQEVLPLLANGTALSSCNTVALSNGKWIGIDTDAEGVRATIQQHHISIANKRVMILGAGGSAATIASVVRPDARELIILSRTLESAEKLAAQFHAKAATLNEFGSFDCDVLWNATPLGLKPGESPVDLSGLRSTMNVIDLIYNPPETSLLQKARALGCTAVNGETWFLAQAEAQFSWWKSLGNLA